jgi:hypothetical protein
VATCAMASTPFTAGGRYTVRRYIARFAGEVEMASSPNRRPRDRHRFAANSPACGSSTR